MKESPAKIKYVGEFSGLKIHSLAFAAWKKIGCRNTLNRSVNKFYACRNLVKFIFKSFVSCNLQFQAFYLQNSTVYRSIFRACEKLSPEQVDFPSRQETFCPSLPNQGPRQAIHQLNFWWRFWEEKVNLMLKGNQEFRQSKWQKLQYIAFCWLCDTCSWIRSEVVA